MGFFPVYKNMIHRKGHFFRGPDIQNLNSCINTKTHESFILDYSIQHVFPHCFPLTVDIGSKFSLKLPMRFCNFLREVILMDTHHELPGSNTALVITYLRDERYILPDITCMHVIVRNTPKRRD